MSSFSLANYALRAHIDRAAGTAQDGLRRVGALVARRISPFTCSLFGARA
jgi:hypothetical protein